jgi:hypothetical protein
LIDLAPALMAVLGQHTAGQAQLAGKNLFQRIVARDAPPDVAAQQEVRTLLDSLRLPLDERGWRRAAARTEWFASRDNPLVAPWSKAPSAYSAALMSTVRSRLRLSNTKPS